jgi:hypothetical protein
MAIDVDSEGLPNGVEWRDSRTPAGASPTRGSPHPGAFPHRRLYNASILIKSND